MTENSLIGVVLAGGASTRMGTDKSRIVYHSQSQYKHVFELLSKYCDKVYVSCKANAGIPGHFNPIEDVFQFTSPLNGIATVVRKNPRHALLAVAVDMPFVDDDTIAYLIRHRDPSKIATCFQDSDGKRPEPMLAVWEPAGYALMEDFIRIGEISPRKFLEQNSANIIKAPSQSVLANINTPEELKMFNSERGK